MSGYVCGGAHVYVWKSKFHITVLSESPSALVRQCLFINLELADQVRLAGTLLYSLHHHPLPPPVLNLFIGPCGCAWVCYLGYSN